jgi:superfamily II DNA or RNA helicase
MVIEEPTRVYLPEVTDRVRGLLTYADRSVQYQMHRMRQNFRWKSGDPEGFQARMDELKRESKKTLVFYDGDGRPYTYSGLVGEIGQATGWGARSLVEYPKDRALPWANKPEFTLRPYQEGTVEALRVARHGAVELPTGSGKSACIAQLVKLHGLPTAVVTPSKAITRQMYEILLRLFGARYVGQFGGSRKKSDKLVTVCTAQSLARLQPGDDHYESLSRAQVFVFDESHTCPADTFEQVCLGVLGRAPYRYFFSATQTRVDGSEVVLKGITGPVVYRKTFRDLVAEGYLAKPVFRVMRVPSCGAVGRSDVNKETREQLFRNPRVVSLAADMADKAVWVSGRQTLVLIDELCQYDLLRNYLTTQHGFISGDTPEDERRRTIDSFNSGQLRMLVGTSAISIGVDLRPTGCLVYLQGGTSEIQVKQAIGRGTRIVPGKSDLWVIDFKVVGSPAMERHSDSRQRIYRELSDDLQEVG